MTTFDAHFPAGAPSLRQAQALTVHGDWTFGANVVVTDTWVSMGQDHAHDKLAAMAPFQVDEALMGAAKGDAIFLHCLPAVKGYEVTEEVFESRYARQFDEAENRMHTIKATMVASIGNL